MQPTAPPRATGPRSFDDAVALALSQRNDAALQRYEQLDISARSAVPTPDHYWPLLYVLGAAKPDERAVTVFDGFSVGHAGHALREVRLTIVQCRFAVTCLAFA